MNQRHWIVLAVGLVVGACASLVAAREVLTPSVETPTDLPQVVVQPLEATVERSVVLTATVSWPDSRPLFSVLSGTITSVDFDSTGLLSSGDQALSVDAVPVTVIEGHTPAYRDLSVGTTGSDVEQLQRFLVQQGFLDQDVDGRYGPLTGMAVRRWKESVAAPVSSSVRLGEVIFVPGLPAQVSPVDLSVGERIVGNVELATVRLGEPHIEVQLGPDQGGLVPVNADVSLRYGSSSSVAGRVSAIERNPETGGFSAQVDITSSAQLDGQGEQVYSAHVVVIPETSGLSLPASAIQVGADGGPFVMTETGDQLPVAVLASDQGISVVSGVNADTRVIVSR